MCAIWLQGMLTKIKVRLLNSRYTVGAYLCSQCPADVKLMALHAVQGVVLHINTSQSLLLLLADLLTKRLYFTTV